MEDPGGLATAGLPMLHPRHRQRFELLVRRVLGPAAQERLSPDERRATCRQTLAFLVRSIDVRVTPDVGDAGEDGMAPLLLDDEAASGVGHPFTVVVQKRAAQNVLPPAHLPAIDLVRQLTDKAVIRGAKRDDGSAGVDILHDVLQLGLRQREQTGEEDDEIGGRQVFQTGDVVLFEFGLFPLLGIHRQGRIHLAALVHAEEHGAVEPMMHAENLRHHGHRLLAAILLVGGNQDDVFAFTRAFAAGIGQPLRILRHGMRENTEAERQESTKEDRLHFVAGTPQRVSSRMNIPGSCDFSSARVKGKKSLRVK